MSDRLDLWDAVLGEQPLRVPWRPSDLFVLSAQLRACRPGARVLLLDGGLLARPRRWWLARRSGLRLERAYLAVPSLSRPLFLVERGRESEAYFASRLLTVPSGLATGAAGVDGLVRLAGWSGARGSLALVARGELTVWRRV